MTEMDPDPRWEQLAKDRLEGMPPISQDNPPPLDEMRFGKISAFCLALGLFCFAMMSLFEPG